MGTLSDEQLGEEAATWAEVFRVMVCVNPAADEKAKTNNKKVLRKQANIRPNILLNNQKARDERLKQPTHAKPVLPVNFLCATGVSITNIHICFKAFVSKTQKCMINRPTDSLTSVISPETALMVMTW